MKNAQVALAAVLAIAAGAASAQDKWVIGQSAPLTGGNAHGTRVPGQQFAIARKPLTRGTSPLFSVAC